MNNDFISKKVIYKKAIAMSVIFLFLGLGLYAFNQVEETINNFKFYYFEAYLGAASFKFHDQDNVFAYIFGLEKNKHTIVTVDGFAKSIPVLLYHGVVSKPDGSNILLEDFKNHLFALKNNGWQTISFEDFHKFTEGEKDLPAKSFLLTFDDGRKDGYYPVDPILKVLDYNATMFVITGRSIGDKSGGSFHLSENELKQMIKSGRWEIQSHGKDDHDFEMISATGEKGHFLSNKLWFENEGRLESDEEFKDRILNDLVGSKRDLEDNLGIKVTGFAFPFGDYGQNSINFPDADTVVLETAKSVYPLSFYQIWERGDSIFNYPAKISFAKRITINPDWKTEDLLNILKNNK